MRRWILMKPQNPFFSRTTVHIDLGSLRDGTLAVAAAAAAARFDLVQRLHRSRCHQVTSAPNARALLCVNVQRVLDTVEQKYRKKRGLDQLFE